MYTSRDASLGDRPVGKLIDRAQACINKVIGAFLSLHRRASSNPREVPIDAQSIAIEISITVILCVHACRLKRARDEGRLVRGSRCLAGGWLKNRGLGAFQPLINGLRKQNPEPWGSLDDRKISSLSRTDIHFIHPNTRFFLGSHSLLFSLMNSSKEGRPGKIGMYSSGACIQIYMYVDHYHMGKSYN